MQADANDYVEKEFGAFYRSYPAQGGDALAYQRSGFLWNAAQRAGLSVADYGEYANFFTAPAPSAGGPSWDDWYKNSLVLEGKASDLAAVGVTDVASFSRFYWNQQLTTAGLLLAITTVTGLLGGLTFAITRPPEPRVAAPGQPIA